MEEEQEKRWKIKEWEGKGNVEGERKGGRRGRQKGEGDAAGTEQRARGGWEGRGPGSMKE